MLGFFVAVCFWGFCLFVLGFVFGVFLVDLLLWLANWCKTDFPVRFKSFFKKRLDTMVSVFT